MSAKTIPSYDSWKYREVRSIVSRFPTGEVRETEFKGFCLASREARADEVTCSISTNQTRKDTITLDPFIE